MSKPKNIFILLSLIISLTLVLFSCSSRSSVNDIAKNRIDYLDKQIIERFNLDTSDCLYQYYQKYGFTDLCIDNRLLFSVDSSIKLKNNLPISTTDIAQINLGLGKVDTISNDSIIYIMGNRANFGDIELDFFSYNSDTNLTLGLKRGKYEFNQTKYRTELIIFDSIQNLIYFEIHECDGD